MAPPPVCTGNGRGCRSLDSQDAIASTPNGKLLFAVNAGSNTVSSFRVTRHGAQLVGQVSSGGQFPNSLTVHGNLLYMLNSNSLNIQGLSFSSSGVLTPISGSSRPLNPTGPFRVRRTTSASTTPVSRLSWRS
jgi:6-phosphogluconolactonase